jgi:very-short-patch-repair endonuclease
VADAEQRLWRHLGNRQLSECKFRRQHAIDNYIVDFVCTKAMLIIELDGGQHAEQLEYDERRTRSLQAKGYRVLRFWNNDVLLDIESVLSVILDNLASPAPHPNPLPARERGEPRGD